MSHQIAVRNAEAAAAGNAAAPEPGISKWTPPQFNVVGMIWIDSLMPLTPQLRAAADGTPDTAPRQPVVTAPGAVAGMTVKEKADVNMAHARIMGTWWEKPSWGAADDTQQQPQQSSTTTTGRRLQPPPTVLLRCRESTVSDGQRFADRWRGERRLGWDAYSAAHGGFVRRVVDIEGHHFNIFDFDRVGFFFASCFASFGGWRG